MTLAERAEHLRQLLELDPDALNDPEVRCAIKRLLAVLSRLLTLGDDPPSG